MHPAERKLPLEMEKEICNLVNLQANKKLIQAQVFEKTEKMITSKDINNIVAKFKKPKQDLDTLIADIKDTHGCDASLLVSENILQGIFFQDEEMRQSYRNFPEIIFFDGTYKLLDIRFTVYIFLIEDGNGMFLKFLKHII